MNRRDALKVIGGLVASFTVRCLPVAQPRQRTRIVQASGGRTFAQNYTPRDAPVNAFKAAIAAAAAELHQGPLMEQPLGVEILFVFPRPGRLVWKTRPMPREWHCGKPDVENLAKSVLDALTNVVWKDDAQVAHLLLRKCYAAGDEAPGVSVTIAGLDPIEEAVGGEEVEQLDLFSSGRE